MKIIQQMLRVFTLVPRDFYRSLGIMILLFSKLTKQVIYSLLLLKKLPVNSFTEELLVLKIFFRYYLSREKKHHF